MVDFKVLAFVIMYSNTVYDFPVYTKAEVVIKHLVYALYYNLLPSKIVHTNLNNVRNNQLNRPHNHASMETQNIHIL